MSILRLLLREIQYRKLNFTLGLVSVVAAVALPVAVLTMCEAANRETTRLMRDMGFNLLIVPADTDMGDFWSRHYSEGDMPEEYVHRISESQTLDVQHLVARLQRRIKWHGRSVLLTGVLPEIQMKFRPQKSAMDLPVDEGMAHLGYELWNSTGLQSGDPLEITVGGRSLNLRVDKCLPEQGSIDDIRLYVHLHQAQALLGMEGRITDIQALSCYCAGHNVGHLRKQLAAELAGTKVSELHSRALTRAEMRATIERYAAFLIPVVIVMCALWVSLLALGNVRERRSEIGILRAMGVGAGKIVLLFLGKAVVLGLLGALIGFPVGTGLALHFGPLVFPVTAKHIVPEWWLLKQAVLAAPVLSAIASHIPAMIAVTQDPAEVLREE
ncbi:MAG: ABC transporter permease [Candidatus Zipacnadales bacterium]